MAGGVLVGGGVIIVVELSLNNHMHGCRSNHNHP